MSKCTGVKNITETINTTNSHLENYCKQQNVGFINNDNIKKSDLNSKGLHLHERGSSKLAKNLLDFIYIKFVNQRVVFPVNLK